ncbi:MAG: hypothetical protein HY039_07580 [Nitrospirae bacterium]|nr:hypothetical protein [Nitrospirota bacterium]
MFPALRTTVMVHLKFYRRDKILLGAVISIFLILSLSLIPSLFFISSSDRLATIKTVFQQLSTFAYLVTAVAVMLGVSDQIRNRSIKMVLTKPFPPEAWLLSVLLSGLIVAAVSYAGILLACSILFGIWGIPYQWGLLFVTANDFMQTLILVSYMTLLAVVFHPVLAAFFAILFHESSFYMLKLLLNGGIQAVGEGSVSFGLKTIRGIVDVVYLATPALTPFSRETETIYSSLRLEDGSVRYLGLAFVYVFVSSTFFFLLAAYFLKKKRLT